MRTQDGNVPDPHPRPRWQIRLHLINLHLVLNLPISSTFLCSQLRSYGKQAKVGEGPLFDESVARFQVLKLSIS